MNNQTLKFTESIDEIPMKKKNEENGKNAIQSTFNFWLIDLCYFPFQPEIKHYAVSCK